MAAPLFKQEDLDALQKCTNQREWDKLEYEIKMKYAGYPRDWYSKVESSGLRAAVVAGFSQ